MNIFKEMPIVFPFYDNEKHFSIRSEHREGNCVYKLISPKNALLPFQINLPVNKPAPIKWEISMVCGKNVIDITNNLKEVKIYSFEEKKQAVYFGEKPLRFKYGNRDEDLNLETGFYFSRFVFDDGSYYVSEWFYVPSDSFRVGEQSNYFKIDFWQDNDVLPLIYRDNWKQTLYLKTFIHAAVPEVEEKTKKDGFNNEIPVFQKMTLKYKFLDIVPDFLKIAIVSLQIQDNVQIVSDNQRSGIISRVSVNAENDENIGMSVVDVTFEDEILTKTSCNNDKPIVSLSNW